MEVVARPHTIQPAILLDIRKVSKFYASVQALKEININIHSGEFVSLVGPSGAGKSTLIRLLIREELPSSGRIFVAGRDITELKNKETPFYRRKIGVVFQDFRLLEHKTVFENVAFALELSNVPDHDIAKKIPQILDLVGLKDKSESYPHELSGGEKQRTAIARALVHTPKILIADEPTGNLDQKNALDVIELLKRINASGTLVLLATHNKAIVDSLHRRVIRIENGIVTGDRQGGYI